MDQNQKINNSPAKNSSEAVGNPAANPALKKANPKVHTNAMRASHKKAQPKKAVAFKDTTHTAEHTAGDNASLNSYEPESSPVQPHYTRPRPQHKTITQHKTNTPNAKKAPKLSPAKKALAHKPEQGEAPELASRPKSFKASNNIAGRVKNHNRPASNLGINPVSNSKDLGVHNAKNTTAHLELPKNTQSYDDEFDDFNSSTGGVFGLLPSKAKFLKPESTEQPENASPANSANSGANRAVPKALADARLNPKSPSLAKNSRIVPQYLKNKKYSGELFERDKLACEFRKLSLLEKDKNTQQVIHNRGVKSSTELNNATPNSRDINKVNAKAENNRFENNRFENRAGARNNKLDIPSSETFNKRADNNALKPNSRLGNNQLNSQAKANLNNKNEARLEKQSLRNSRFNLKDKNSLTANNKLNNRQENKEKAYSTNNWPSKPARPPKDGIKASSKGFVESWWARTWLNSLEEALGHSTRLNRGKQYAKEGHVTQIVVEKSRVQATVHGNHVYHVQFELSPLSFKAWSIVGRVLGSQAGLAARLLNGDLPKEVELGLARAGLSLTPDFGLELSTHCTCPDNSNPCKHIAAVHYLLAEEIDRSPLLLFRLRGKEREEVLTLIADNALKQDGSENEKDKSLSENLVDESNDFAEGDEGLENNCKNKSHSQSHSQNGERSEKSLSKCLYANPEPMPTIPDFFWGKILSMQALPMLGEIEKPETPDALLHSLGEFPFWRGDEDLHKTLQKVYEYAVIVKEEQEAEL